MFIGREHRKSLSYSRSRQLGQLFCACLRTQWRLFRVKAINGVMGGFVKIAKCVTVTHTHAHTHTLLPCVCPCIGSEVMALVQQRRSSPCYESSNTCAACMWRKIQGAYACGRRRLSRWAYLGSTFLYVEQCKASTNRKRGKQQPVHIFHLPG